MAFVFKADKPSIISTKENFPGPGQYELDVKPEIEPNFVSFLTGGKRTTSNPANPTNPGPGTYNLPVSIQGYNQKEKTFYSSLNPNMESLEERQQSTTFKSTTKRDAFNQNSDQPGPGSYFRHTGQRTVQENNTANFRKPVDREKVHEVGSVPSIPTFIHAYGYTETGNKGLRLNKNPLLEVQKFVGPGYYDVEQPRDPVKAKGIAWDKPHADRNGGSFGLQIGTGANLGPGSYKVKSRGIFPLYKLKPSAGFASKQGRSMYNNKKKAVKKARNLMEEQAQDIEDLAEEAPGPGYYHNSSTATSFSQSQRPSTLQFFGSGSERFSDTFSTTTHMGPGKYNTGKDIAKKIQKNPNMQIPFINAVPRFEEKLEEVPGPGEYEVRSKIGEIVTNVVPKNQVESFGATENRFKSKSESAPGPGAYLKTDKDGKLKGTVDPTLGKSSHMFSSTSKREVIKTVGNVPPPGSYDVNNFNLATKVSKPEYDDPDLSPKKPPFNTATERFKNPAVKIDEEDNDDSFEDEWDGDGHTRGDLILKVRNQPKPTSVFTSQTKRVGVPVGKEKAYVPGPGKYYGTNQEDWIKKTYNVNFTTD